MTFCRNRNDGIVEASVAHDDASCPWWRDGEGAGHLWWTLVEPVFVLGGAGSETLRHRASNRDILGFALCFFFFPLNGFPHTSHTHTQTPNTLGLKWQSDRTATLRIRVTSVAHVLCHINSCWGEFGNLAPPPSLPITGKDYEAYIPKFSNHNGRELWVNCFFLTEDGSEGSCSSVGLVFSVIFLSLDHSLIPTKWVGIE